MLGPDPHHGGPDPAAALLHRLRVGQRHLRLQRALHVLRRADDARFGAVPREARARSLHSRCGVNRRGSEQSRPRDAVRAEIEALVAEGYREVTLLGQNIDSWGSDLSPKQSFADLLRDVGGVDGLARMRFVTSHPR